MVSSGNAKPHGGAESVPKVIAAGGVLFVFSLLRGEPAAVDGAEQTVPPSVDHAAYGAGLSIALAPVTCDLLLLGPPALRWLSSLDACELFGRVGGREEAVLDAAALAFAAPPSMQRGWRCRCGGRWRGECYRGA